MPERWKRSTPRDFSYFKRLSLKEAGLHVGLGHDGDLCPHSNPNDTFTLTVLHTNGQHIVRFRDCFCDDKERWQRLLEYGVFPATEKNPQTGFTIEMLEHQQSFSIRGQTSLLEYYQALTDLLHGGEGRLNKSFSVSATWHCQLLIAFSHSSVHPCAYKNIYDQLREVTRQFRALTMFMRAGREEATTPLANGELCVLCPACPQPGMNLRPNWEEDPLK